MNRDHEGYQEIQGTLGHEERLVLQGRSSVLKGTTTRCWCQDLPDPKEHPDHPAEQGRALPDPRDHKDPKARKALHWPDPQDPQDLQEPLDQKDVRDTKVTRVNQDCPGSPHEVETRSDWDPPDQLDPRDLQDTRATKVTVGRSESRVLPAFLAGRL